MSALMGKYIPSKLSRTRASFPWVTQEIRRLLKKRDRLYIKTKKGGRQEDQTHFRALKKHIQKTIRQEYWKYIQEIVTRRQPA